MPRIRLRMRRRGDDGGKKKRRRRFTLSIDGSNYQGYSPKAPYPEVVQFEDNSRIKELDLRSGKMKDLGPGKMPGNPHESVDVLQAGDVRPPMRYVDLQEGDLDLLIQSEKRGLNIELINSAQGEALTSKAKTGRPRL